LSVNLNANRAKDRITASATNEGNELSVITQLAIACYAKLTEFEVGNDMYVLGFMRPLSSGGQLIALVTMKILCTEGL